MSASQPPRDPSEKGTLLGLAVHVVGDTTQRAAVMTSFASDGIRSLNVAVGIPQKKGGALLSCQSNLTNVATVSYAVPAMREGIGFEISPETQGVRPRQIVAGSALQGFLAETDGLKQAHLLRDFFESRAKAAHIAQVMRAAVHSITFRSSMSAIFYAGMSHLLEIAEAREVAPFCQLAQGHGSHRPRILPAVFAANAPTARGSYTTRHDTIFLPADLGVDALRLIIQLCAGSTPIVQAKGSSGEVNFAEDPEAEEMAGLYGRDAPSGITPLTGFPEGRYTADEPRTHPDPAIGHLDVGTAPADGMAGLLGRAASLNPPAKGTGHVTTDDAFIVGSARREIPVLASRVVILFNDVAAINREAEADQVRYDKFVAHVMASDVPYAYDEVLQLLCSISSEMEAIDDLILGLGSCARAFWPASHTTAGPTIRAAYHCVGLPRPNTDYMLWRDAFAEGRTFDVGITSATFVGFRPSELLSTVCYVAACEASVIGLMGSLLPALSGKKAPSWRQLSIPSLVSSGVSHLGAKALCSPWSMCTSRLAGTVMPAVSTVLKYCPALGAGQLPSYTRWEILDVNKASSPDLLIGKLVPAASIKATLRDTSLELSGHVHFDGAFQLFWLAATPQAKRGLAIVADVTSRGRTMEFNLRDALRGTTLASSSDEVVAAWDGRYASISDDGLSPFPALTSLPASGPGGISIRYTVRPNVSATAAEQNAARMLFTQLGLLQDLCPDGVRCEGLYLSAPAVVLPPSELLGLSDWNDYEVDEPGMTFAELEMPRGTVAAPSTDADFQGRGPDLAAPEGGPPDYTAQPGQDGNATQDNAGGGEPPETSDV